MSTADDQDEILYTELLDYESATANASLRFEDQTSEKVRMTLFRADGQLRYWVFVYIVASRLVRHANITITAAVYTDNRGRVTSGLGSALS